MHHHPDSELALQNCAACCIELKMYEQAHDTLNTLLEIHQESAQAYLSRGICWKRQQEWEKAEADFLKAKELNPDDTDPLVFIVEMHVRNRNSEAAVKYAKEILEQDEQNLTAAFHLAQAYSQLGQFEDALGMLELAQRLSPESIPVLTRTSWLLATCPDDAVRDGLEALDVAELACDLTDNKDPHALSILAAAHAELGEF